MEAQYQIVRCSPSEHTVRCMDTSVEMGVESVNSVLQELGYKVFQQARSVAGASTVNAGRLPPFLYFVGNKMPLGAKILKGGHRNMTKANSTMHTRKIANPETTDKPEVQSVMRAINILYAFTAGTPQLAVADIAKIVGLNRTTVHRLVGTLEASGLIRRDPYSQKFGLSAQVLRLAEVFYQQNDIRTIALPRMTALRDELNETVGLHQREGFARVVVSQVGAHRDVRHMYRNIGEPIPLHLGAPGKVILANLKHDEIEHYLTNNPLEGTTSHSVTDPDVLRSELEAVSEQGYAISWEERRVGVVAMAAPIFDAYGHVVASMNISGPSQRIKQEQVDAMCPRLVEVTKEVSFSFAYQDGSRTGD